ncbi:MAG: hypothetical protein RIE58_07090 [Vicingaceae bacterium]
MKNITFLFFVFPIILFGQKSELLMFNNLVEKTWKAEGNWADGSKFYQEISMQYSLDSTIIVVNSIGFIDLEQTKLGLRNHGIRQFDNESNRINFWEFDIKSELTKGIVFSEGNNIIYQYDYNGSIVTDMWEYVDDSTYNFKIGNYEDGLWKLLFLSTKFVCTNGK